MFACEVFCLHMVRSAGQTSTFNGYTNKIYWGRHIQRAQSSICIIYIHASISQHVLHIKERVNRNCLADYRYQIFSRLDRMCRPFSYNLFFLFDYIGTIYVFAQEYVYLWSIERRPTEKKSIRLSLAHKSIEKHNRPMLALVQAVLMLLLSQLACHIEYFAIQYMTIDERIF